MLHASGLTRGKLCDLVLLSRLGGRTDVCDEIPRHNSRVSKPHVHDDQRLEVEDRPDNKIVHSIALCNQHKDTHLYRAA